MIDYINYNVSRIRKKIMLSIFRKSFGVPKSNYRKILNKEQTNEMIKRFIQDDKPRLLCRLGSVELSAIKACLEQKRYDRYLKRGLSRNAGFFSTDIESIDKFVELNLKYLKEADLIGVWFNPYEDILMNEYAKNAELSYLNDFSSPYFSNNPWSQALEGKIVLVIHPFENSIKKQYSKKRELLFNNSHILPKFQLKTLKAVQSIGGNHKDFSNWFEALEYMQEKIEKIEFDIAIIGAGAYGLPLAGYIKNLGKKAIHLGGATQILFGIKGKRWEDREDFKTLFNEYWTNPLDKEKPESYHSVENGCYW